MRDKKGKLTFELSEDINDSQVQNPFKQLEWKDIYFYLDKLPERTRVVCTLFYIEGFSIQEISAGLNMKLGTVKWHLSECRTKLKDILFNIETKAV